MPRGVLSEDGLDNLLSDIASVRARIAALVEEPDDKNWGTKYQEYHPLVDSPESIPEKPGSLIVVPRYMSSCPETWNLNLKEFEGQDVLFVGDTKNLRQRIVGNHFRSNSALVSNYCSRAGTVENLPLLFFACRSLSFTIALLRSRACLKCSGDFE